MSISLCASSVANTGAIQCDVAPGIPVKFMIWNDSEAIADIEGSQFQPFMEAGSKLSKSDAGKIFVFPVIQDITDSSEANKEGTLNQGFKTVLLEGKPAYTFKVFAGQSSVPNLRKFNNQNVRLLILDANNRVWGVKSGTNFVGAQAKIFVGGLKFPTGQNVEDGVVTISVSYLVASELNDDAAFGEIDSAAAIIGLLDANVTYISSVDNVYKIGVNVPTSEIGQTISLYDQYADELATASLWVLKTGTTTLGITSVAKDDTLGAWTVTTTENTYDFGDVLKLNLKAPPILDAADVTEIEGNETVIPNNLGASE